MLSTQPTLQSALRQLGIEQGDTVMVHASLRAIGPMEGRAEGLVSSLLRTVGSEGTIMAYVDFERTSAVPYFDIKNSPARPDYGVFAEILRTWPEAFRSSNPGASVAAVGAKAKWLCADHALNYGYGEGSPLEKLVELDGKVLLLGSDLDQVTLLHYAEHIAPLSNKRIVTRDLDIVDSNGLVKSVTIEEFDTSNPVLERMPQKMFHQIISDFLAAGLGTTGKVGQAKSHLLPARKLVNFSLDWMVQRYGG